MKKRFGLLLATLLVASTAAFAGCDMLGGNSSSEDTSSVTTSSPADSSSVAPATYTVTFNSDGGSEVAPATVTDGEKVTKPTDPTKAGYTFAGWYLGETAFDFENVAITTNVTLMAKWNVVTYTATVVKADSTEVEVEFTVENKTAKLAEIVAMLPADTAEFDYEWTEDLPTELALNDTQVFTYTKATQTYTITFVDGNGNTMKSGKVPYGEMPVAPTETPTKTATAQYTYTFKAWDSEISAVTGEKTYTATFNETVNNYTLTFETDGGTTIDPMTVPYGTPASELSKVTTTKTNYTFVKWQVKTGENTYEDIPATAKVETNMTLKAVWTATEYTATVVRAYATNETVTFTIENKADKLTYIQGLLPTATAEYTYAWATALPSELALASGQEFTIVRTPVEYTVTVDKVEGDNATVEFTVENREAKLAEIAAMLEEDTAEWDYEWTNMPTELALENGKTITEGRTKKTYTVKFVDEDGTTELKSETLEYGATPVAPADPTKEATAQYTYKFSGWTPEVAAVTGAATYTATYSSTVNKYTVTWSDGQNTWTTNEVEYGTTVSLPENPEKEDVVFVGWTANGKAFTAETVVTGDVTVEAVWDQIVKITNTNLSVEIAGIYTVNTSTDNEKTFTLDEVAIQNGLTINENVVTIPADKDLVGKTFTVTATSMILATNEASITITIAAPTYLKVSTSTVTLGSDPNQNAGTTGETLGSLSDFTGMLAGKTGTFLKYNSNGSATAYGLIPTGADCSLETKKRAEALKEAGYTKVSVNVYIDRNDTKKIHFKTIASSGWGGDGARENATALNPMTEYSTWVKCSFSIDTLINYCQWSKIYDNTNNNNTARLFSVWSDDGAIYDLYFTDFVFETNEVVEDPVVITNKNTEVGFGTTYIVRTQTSANKTYTLDATAIENGLTISGNVVTIPASKSIAGTTFTVTATSTTDPTNTDSITVTIETPIFVKASTSTMALTMCPNQQQADGLGTISDYTGTIGDKTGTFLKYNSDGAASAYGFKPTIYSDWAAMETMLTSLKAAGYTKITTSMYLEREDTAKIHFKTIVWNGWGGEGARENTTALDPATEYKTWIKLSFNIDTLINSATSNWGSTVLIDVWGDGGAVYNMYLTDFIYE